MQRLNWACVSSAGHKPNLTPNLSDYDSGDWGISQLTLGLFSLYHRQLSLDTDTTSLTLLEHMVQGPTNTVHSGRPGVPHSHLRVGFRDFLTQHWVSSLSLCLCLDPTTERTDTTQSTYNLQVPPSPTQPTGKADLSSPRRKRLRVRVRGCAQSCAQRTA